jgi:Xaa-Pro dipeptidase
MTTQYSISDIQNSLIEEHLDGWLLCDFRGNNAIARKIAQFGDKIATRRWYYLIPAKGEPMRVVHAIESHNLDHLPGEKIIFRGWQDLHQALKKALQGIRRIAMEYSPDNDIPYVSLVDAGTIELVKKLGVEVASSGDLVQLFEARWDEGQRKSHFQAVSLVNQVKDDGFRFIGEHLRSRKKLTEYDVQQYMWERFEQVGLFADHPAIVAVNANASNPHYAPDKDKHTAIKEGDLVLIDIWGKMKSPGSIYGDITWMGMAGKQPTARHKEIFDIVKNAQMASFNLIAENFRNGRPTYGFEADDAARKHISDRGYGDYFLHRTGHNIGEEVHGNGAHLDNLETRDKRKLIPDTGFSIEPGIYLPEFGVRSEIDVFIGKEGPVITSPHQTEILSLL